MNKQKGLIAMKYINKRGNEMAAKKPYNCKTNNQEENKIKLNHLDSNGEVNNGWNRELLRGECECS
jgi:hypothetical protein